jgi:hypothetical protein
MTSSEKKSAGPTSIDASVTNFQRSGVVGTSVLVLERLDVLVRASSSTMDASTPRRSAIAMPARRGCLRSRLATASR